PCSVPRRRLRRRTWTLRLQRWRRPELGGWRSFPSLFDPSLSTMHQLAADKPIQISEVSSAEAGGDKAAWITGMFSDLRGHQQVKSIVWFNVRKQTDWRIASSR